MAAGGRGAQCGSGERHGLAAAAPGAGAGDLGGVTSAPCRGVCRRPWRQVGQQQFDGGNPHFCGH